MTSLASYCWRKEGQLSWVLELMRSNISPGGGFLILRKMNKNVNISRRSLAYLLCPVAILFVCADFNEQNFVFFKMLHATYFFMFFMTPALYILTAWDIPVLSISILLITLFILWQMCPVTNRIATREFKLVYHHLHYRCWFEPVTRIQRYCDIYKQRRINK